VPCRRVPGLAWLARLWSGAFVVLVVPGARADSPDATGSFDYGLSEMLAGRYATGCPALESSFRLDPRPGTLFTLADCDRKWGKTASALARFVEYLALYERMPPDSQARQRERASVAAAERAALERTVPLLSVRLPGDAPPGTRVWRDDVELTGPALSAMVPVDPGEHRVRVELPGGRASEQRISIEVGEQRTLVVDLAGEAPQQAAPSVVPPGPQVAQPSPSPSARPPARGSSHAGWIYVAGGAAAASLVVAGITGGIALSDKSTASAACNAQGICTTEQGVNAGNEARTMANVETGALIVGAAALVVTALLWWTEPRGHEPRANAMRNATHEGTVLWSTAGAAWVW
jgi:hypothetical protein